MKNKTIYIIAAAVVVLFLFYRKKKKENDTDTITPQVASPELSNKKTVTQSVVKLPYIKQDTELAEWLYNNLSENDLKSIREFMIWIYRDANGEQTGYKKEDISDDKKFVLEAAWQAFAGEDHPADMEFDGGYSNFDIELEML